MFKNILVPLDGSPAAEAALEMACYLANLVSGQILLVRCTTLQIDLGYPPGFPLPQSALDTEQADCAAYLQQHAARLQGLGFQVKSKVLPSGDPASKIVASAESHGCDAIVLTSHGRTGVPRFLMGSVAERVCRTAQCPVLLVGPEARHQRQA